MKNSYWRVLVRVGGFIRIPRIQRIILGTAVCIIFPGCASTSMSPDKPDSLSLIDNPYATTTDPTLAKWVEEIDKYYAIPSVLSITDRKIIRDDLFYATANAIDQNYYKYRESLLTEQAWTQTAVDTIITGLGSAGALTGGTELKSILAAASAGVSATHSSYVKNFFNNNAPTVVVSRMDALRASKWATIYAKLSSPDDGSAKSYSLSEAAHDLIDYYYAGTVVTAYQDIIAESGAKQTAANDTITAEISARFGQPVVAAEDPASEKTLQILINGLEGSSPTLGDSKGDKLKPITTANLSTIVTSILKAYDSTISPTEQGTPLQTLAAYASERSDKADTTKFLAAFDSVYTSQP